MSESTAPFPDESNDQGEFVRQRSAFRRQVRRDGSGDFEPAAGRYHLYVSLACPWAHRAIIVRKLKGLEPVIGMTVVDPIRDERGWRFTYEPDPVEGFELLSEAYRRTDPSFEGRVTVPVLWDKESRSIVNNESAEILRMLNSEFDEWGDASIDLYPQELREEIDAVNERVYENVNDGVYRAGFATTQSAYEKACRSLFETLGELDERLASRRFLCGERMTEADWRLFTTLLRFDAVYHGHFKCNLRRIADHRHLWPYARSLYQQPGVAATCDFDHVKRHYYVTHRTINPTGIVPLGPELDWSEPHGRD